MQKLVPSMIGTPRRFRIPRASGLPNPVSPSLPLPRGVRLPSTCRASHRRLLLPQLTSRRKLSTPILPSPQSILYPLPQHHKTTAQHVLVVVFMSPVSFPATLVGVLRLFFLFLCVIPSATAGGVTSQSMATTTTHPGAIIEGVTVPATQTLLGRTFYRKGYGLRRFQWYGMQMRIYVAARWMEDASSSEDQVFTFTFLRAFPEGRVRAAWRYQLGTSATECDYAEWEQDKEAFIQLFGGIERMGTEQVLLLGNDTIVMEDGVEKGKITGRSFQKAFLSMWFGEKAVSEELKEGLLGVGQGQTCLDKSEDEQS